MRVWVRLILITIQELCEHRVILNEVMETVNPDAHALSPNFDPKANPLIQTLSPTTDHTPKHALDELVEEVIESRDHLRF